MVLINTISSKQTIGYITSKMYKQNLLKYYRLNILKFHYHAYNIERSSFEPFGTFEIKNFEKSKYPYIQIGEKEQLSIINKYGISTNRIYFEKYKYSKKY